MTNAYSSVTAALVTSLSALTGYAGLVVKRQQFRPATLPPFSTYCIIVSPASNPWREHRLAVREIEYHLAADLFLLVRNFHTEDALFGTTPGALGLFQMVSDVKDLLRIDTLDGLLSKTYDEPGGDAASMGPGGVDFQEFATAGLDAGEHTFINRARVPFLARMRPFCHAKAA